jgi:hypothetical protein
MSSLSRRFVPCFIVAIIGTYPNVQFHFILIMEFCPPTVVYDFGVLFGVIFSTSSINDFLQKFRKVTGGSFVLHNI